jgi:hypothetical protein
MDEDQIQSEIDAAIRELMELSEQRKVFGQKSPPTDSGFWKLGPTNAASDMACIAV